MRAARRTSEEVGKLVDHKNELASLLPGPWGHQEISIALTYLPRVAPVTRTISSLPDCLSLFHWHCPKTHDHSVVSLELLGWTPRSSNHFLKFWVYARKEVSFTDLVGLLQPGLPAQQMTHSSSQHRCHESTHRGSSAQCPTKPDTACSRKDATWPTSQAQAHGVGVRHFKIRSEEHKWEAMDNLCLAYQAADTGVHILTPAVMRSVLSTHTLELPWSLYLTQTHFKATAEVRW